MGWIDDVVTELQKSDAVSAEALVRIAQFLQGHQALLEAVTDEARQAFLAALGRGDAAGAWEALTSTLNSGQLLALLKEAAGEIADLATARHQAVAQFQGVIDDAGKLAIGLLVKAGLAIL